MVVTGVEVLELLKREVGDHFRVSTGVGGVVVVGEELRLYLLVVHRVWLRVHALHFVEHDALEHHVRVLLVEFEVPALLLENFGVLEASGMEHCVQVHVAEIVEVLKSPEHPHVAFVAYARSVCIALA
jgi:hypothetical protein